MALLNTPPEMMEYDPSVTREWTCRG